MATALEVTHVLFIQDATNQKVTFPPGFSSGIPKMTIGVVTKADSEQADVDQAIAKLKKSMVQGPIVVTSSFKQQGMEEIKGFVSCNSYQEMKEYYEKVKKPSIFYKESLFK